MTLPSKYDAILRKMELEEIALIMDMQKYCTLRCKSKELDNVIKKREREINQIREEIRQVQRELSRKSA